MATHDRLLTYTEWVQRTRDDSSTSRLAIPLGYAASLTLPTKRWGRPGYAAFASPAPLLADRPVVQGVPDYWWVNDACGNGFLLYAYCYILPFAEGVDWQPVTLPETEKSVEEQHAERAFTERLLDEVVLPFFRGEEADPQERSALLAVLQRRIPELLRPQYQALVPDFFAWLQAR